MGVVVDLLGVVVVVVDVVIEGSLSEDARLVAVLCVDSRSKTLPLVPGVVFDVSSTPSVVVVLEGVFNEEPRFTAPFSDAASGDGRPEAATDARFPAPVVVLSAVLMEDERRTAGESAGLPGLLLSRRVFCVP